MTLPVQDIPTLTAQLHAAVVDDTAWAPAVASIAGALGASGAVLFSPQPEHAGFIAASAGTARDSIGDYLTQWRQHDAWIHAADRMDAFRSGGEVSIGRSVLPGESLRRTEFHGGFLRHADIDELLSMKVCDDTEPGVPTMHLSLFRSARQPLFDESDRRRLAALWAPLRRAVWARARLARDASLERAIDAVLDRLPTPVFVLRRDATLDFANAAAAAMFTDGCASVRHGRLTRLGDLVETDLRVALGPGAAAPPALALLGRDPPAVARLDWAPVAPGSPQAARWPLAQALLIVTPPPTATLREQARQRIARHYGLTGAELRVVDQLLDGAEPQVIAAALGVAMTTVRTHLRALFDKTGCRRQGELLRLLSRWGL